MVGQRKKGAEELRVVWANSSAQNRERQSSYRTYCLANAITTSHYTWYGFLPVNLFQQFTRIANLYFLLLVCIMLVPDLSPVSPITTVIPLSGVLAVTMLKDGFDDWRRHRSDRYENHRSVQVLLAGLWKTVCWKDLEVGNVIRLSAGQPVPADILVLSTSDNQGVCYIATADLDGETNLKKRRGLAATRHVTSTNGLAQLGARLECEVHRPASQRPLAIGPTLLVSSIVACNAVDILKSLAAWPGNGRRPPTRRLIHSRGPSLRAAMTVPRQSPTPTSSFAAAPSRTPRRCTGWWSTRALIPS